MSEAIWAQIVGGKPAGVHHIFTLLQLNIVSPSTVLKDNLAIWSWIKDRSSVAKWLLIVAVLMVVVAAVTPLFVDGFRADQVTYQTAPVQKGDLVTTINATGSVRAVLSVAVGSQLSGQISQLFADFNDVVTKGQPIAQLDQRTFAAKVREAEAAIEVAKTNVLIKQATIEKAGADLANATAAQLVTKEREAGLQAIYERFDRDLKRKGPLSKRGTVSVSALDQVRADRDSAAADLRAAKAERAVRRAEIASAQATLRITEADFENALALVEQRRAALEQAQVELERTVIRAPIDGVIIGRNIDRGQTVAASLESPTLFEIANDLNEMEVHAQIDEADIGRIRDGQRVKFTVDSYPGKLFTGKVVQIRKAPRTIQNVVIFTVVVSAANPNLLLLPGMTASVRIVVRETVGVLKVPNTALRFNPPGVAESGRIARGRDEARQAGPGIPASLWVLDDQGRPAPVAVRVGESDRRATEILSGPLTPGQNVIVGAGVPDDGVSVFGLRLNF